MKKIALKPEVVSTVLLLISSVCLIGLQYKPEGWLLLALSGISLILANKKFRHDMLLIHAAIIILGITEINTSITYRHMVETGILLTLAVAIPYVISNRYFKDRKIIFKWGNVKKWSRKQFGYLIFTAAVGYLVIPFYLISSGAYINWPSEADFSSLIRLFIGTNGLGIWDELFFVIVVLGLLKQHLKFFWANISQAVLWTAFLYELGFTGWGPYIVFLFALLQGYVFTKTHSLLYVITIHLTVDFILFLALVNAHNPTMFNFFLT